MKYALEQAVFEVKSMQDLEVCSTSITVVNLIKD